MANSQESQHSRRAFLGKAGLAMAAPVLAELAGVRTAFADQVGPMKDFASLPEAYSLKPGLTYLNHASIGTVPRAVQEAQRKYLEICESNPWMHIWSETWKEPREEVRRRAAQVLGCHPETVAITHNTTETFNLLAQGLPLGKGDEVVMSSLNHSGASVCWEHHAAVRGYRVQRFDFPVLDVPRMNAEDVVDIYTAQIGRRTKVLVFPHVDNMIGLRHPVREIARAARAKGVRWIAVDGAQTVGMIPLRVDKMDVDAYATSPHKWLQSPKGLGLTYLRQSLQEELHPMWVTWGQRTWKGSVKVYEDYGTRNLPEVLALGDAIEFQQRLGATQKEEHHRRLWQHSRNLVDKASNLTWRSPESWDLGAALYAIEVSEESSALFQRLFEEHGFVFRPFSQQGLNTIRLSPNVGNSTEDLDRLFALLG